MDSSAAVLAVPSTSMTRFSDDTSKPAAPADALSEARIDVWRDQIRAGLGGTVIEPLEKFIGTLSANASPQVLFRAYANLGAALEQAGRREESLEMFERAAAAKPGTADSATYSARVRYGRNNTPGAYELANRAVQLDPQQRLAAAILIDTAPPEVRAAELEARIGDLAQFPDVAAGLSARYSDEDDHLAARRVAKGANPIDAVTPVGFPVAIAILKQFDMNLDLRMGLPLPAAQQALLEEARTLLEEAWIWASGRADKRNWLFVGANLVSAYRLTREEEKADDLALEIYAADGDSPPLMERAVVALVHKHDPKAALQVAERLADADASRAALMAADISVLAGEWSKAVKWAGKAFADASSDADRARAAERIVLGTLQHEGAGPALAEAERLRPAIPPNVAFEARVAEAARRLGDSAQSEAANARLQSFIAADLDSMQRFELANAFADQSDWSRAAELLKGLYSLDKATEPLLQRLLYLYRADQRVEAREFYESLTGDALTTTSALRLGAAIYEKAGLLPQAIGALEAALSIDAGNLRSRLDWVALRLRNNEEDVVREWISTAEINHAADPEDLLELAQLFDRFARREDALALGYEILRKHWGNEERVHTGYIGLFLLNPQMDAALDPDTVALDTVAFLQSDRGVAADYRIEAGANGPGVLQPDQAFAKLLLGKKVGDTVSVQGIGQADTWTIQAIKHKYIDLLHRALESHETNFPGSKAIGRFSIEPDAEGGFEPLFEQVRQRARYADRAIRIYQENPVPVESVARLLGVNVVDGARRIRFQAGITLEACLGTEAERQQGRAQLAGASELLVDALTLSIWQDVGLLVEIEKIPDLNICLVQATIDLLAQRVEDAMQNAGQKGGSLHAVGDQIAMIEPTQAERDQYLDSCTELLDWCRQHARIVATEALNSDGLASSVLSPATVATLGTLVAHDMPAVIEDLRLRGLAASFGATRTGWTQALLMNWLDAGTINRAEYTGYLAKLHMARVGFVSVAAEDLLEAMRSDDPSIIQTLVSTLRMPTVESGSLGGVVANFIVRLWLDDGRNDRRDRLASDLLELVVGRPDGIDISGNVVVHVFRVLEAQGLSGRLVADWWFEYVERFTKGHFIQQALLDNRSRTPSATPPRDGRRRRRRRR